MCHTIINIRSNHPCIVNELRGMDVAIFVLYSSPTLEECCKNIKIKITNFKRLKYLEFFLVPE